MLKKSITLILVGVVAFVFSGCGTLFHPERRDATPSTEVDPVVLILDCWPVLRDRPRSGCSDHRFQQQHDLLLQIRGAETFCRRNAGTFGDGRRPYRPDGSGIDRESDLRTGRPQSYARRTPARPDSVSFHADSPVSRAVRSGDFAAPCGSVAVDSVRGIHLTFSLSGTLR